MPEHTLAEWFAILLSGVGMLAFSWLICFPGRVGAYITRLRTTPVFNDEQWAELKAAYSGMAESFANTFNWVLEFLWLLIVAPATWLGIPEAWTVFVNFIKRCSIFCFGEKKHDYIVIFKAEVFKDAAKELKATKGGFIKWLILIPTVVLTIWAIWDLLHGATWLVFLIALIGRVVIVKVFNKAVIAVYFAYLYLKATLLEMRIWVKEEREGWGFMLCFTLMSSAVIIVALYFLVTYATTHAWHMLVGAAGGDHH